VQAHVLWVNRSTGILNFFAGSSRGFGGDGGPATSAQLDNPTGLTVDAANNVYIADTNNHRIRKVDGTTGIISTVAGGGANNPGDGGLATNATLSYPSDVAFDAAGNMFIAQGSRIRRVDAATGIIMTVAGTGTGGYTGDGGPATSAQIVVTHMTVDRSGNIYFNTGMSYDRIRRVDAATGIITTFAGTGTKGYNGDGIAATTANLTTPYSLGVDRQGNVYIAEYNGPGLNCRVRKVLKDTGIIMTAAGTGNYGNYSGDGTPALLADLNHPWDVFVDDEGNIYISIYYNNHGIIKVKVLND